MYVYGTLKYVFDNEVYLAMQHVYSMFMVYTQYIYMNLHSNNNTTDTCMASPAAV